MKIRMRSKAFGKKWNWHHANKQRRSNDAKWTEDNRNPGRKICDYIDGKFRNDTPEEYVRQTIEKRLVNEHKYLPEQIRIEYTLQVGSNKPRADIVIWEKGADQTQGTIKLIIECKKETVDARNAKDGIAQLKSYMSVCPNCEWGMWTNSVQKYVFRKAVDAAGNITFMEYNDIPAADGNLDEVNRPSRNCPIHARQLVDLPSQPPFS